MREYINSQVSTDCKARRQFFNSTKFVPGEEAPINAPHWTKVGYDGSLKGAVESYSGVRHTPHNTDDTETEQFGVPENLDSIEEYQDDNEAWNDRDDNAEEVRRLDPAVHF